MRKLHRVAAFTFGILFCLLGLSGSWLVFYPELDALLLGVGTQTPTHGDIAWQRILDESDVALRSGSGMTVMQRPFGDHGPVLVMSQTGPSMVSSDFHQAYLDPTHATVLATKSVLSATQPWYLNITGVMVEIHTAAALGSAGYPLIAFVGVWLLIMLLAGAWMTWPRGRRWRAMFRLQAPAGSKAFLSELHRVSGLYAVAFLAVIVLTGIYFSLRPYVENVLSKVVAVTTALPVHHSPPPGAHASTFTLDEIVDQARARFPSRRLQAITLMRGGATSYTVSLAAQDNATAVIGATELSFDASGVMQYVRDPAQETAADRVLRWARPLHTGAAFGWPGRATLFMLGLLPTVFFATGVTIWLRERRRRTRSAGTRTTS